MAFSVFFFLLPLEWMNNPQRLKGRKTLYYRQNHPNRHNSSSYSMYKYLCGIHIWVRWHSPGGGGCLAHRAALSGTQRSGFQKHQRDLKRVFFRRNRALCSHGASFAWLAHRAGVLASGIFTNKWTILAELAATVCILNQAVPADAVPRRVIAMQGVRAAALQWLLLAVTAINHSRDGWSGSAELRVNKHTQQHIWQMFQGTTRSSKRPSTTPTMSHMAHAQARTDTGLWDAYRMHGWSNEKAQA